MRTAKISPIAIWVAVVPAFVTAIGLIFAVLIERIRWSVAFKTVVFLPMAISAFATGVTWRIMYLQDPSQGAINALGRSVSDAVTPPGVLPRAVPSTGLLQPHGGGLLLKTPLHPGGVALLGLTGIAPADLPSGSRQAAQPTPKPGNIEGVVWRDFKPGGGKPGVVEQGELGIRGVTVELRNSSGDVVQSAKTEASGAFDFTNVAAGTYNAGIGGAAFAQPVCGYSSLRAKLVTPSLLLALILILAGLSLVGVAAGASAPSPGGV